MATWKKIIVSGSSAVLGGVSLPSLTTNNLVQVGASGTLQNSGISLASSTASFGDVSLISTSGGSNLSGSFSGSFAGAFSGTFTGTSNLPDLTDGNGIVDFTYDGASTATIAVEADGATLTVGASGVKVSDAGITATQIATSVAGTGLSGGGGTALSVDYGSDAGTAVQGNTNISISGTPGEIGVTGTVAQALGGGPSYTIIIPDTIQVSRT